MGTMQPREPRPQTIVVVHKQDNRAVWHIFWLLVFGPVYLVWLALKWTCTVGWRLFVAYPWKACVAAGRATVRAGRWYNARYGARGWIVLAVVVVVLAIIGKITGN